MARLLETQFNRARITNDPVLVPSILFGELVKIGKVWIQNYWSDLYHDAHMLGQMLPASKLTDMSEGSSEVFHWSCGTCGTHMMENKEWYDAVHSTYAQDRFYEVIVRKEQNGWYSFQIDFIRRDD